MCFSISRFSLFCLFCSILIKVADNLVAYDRRNELLNIPENEIHVITEAIDNFKPKLRVQFINFQNVKRRKATKTRDGRIKIETRVRNQQKPIVEPVQVEPELIQLRFGGGSKAHFPYNRVVNWRNRNEVSSESREETTTTTTTKATEPSITPQHWAKTTTTSLSPYSAEPALILPSRFHRKKEDVVIVFKKKQKS